jgi:hypothetical protein
LLLREKSRLSFLPAMRSSCSLFDQPSPARLLDFDFLDGLAREDCALARAPNDIDAGSKVSCSASDSSSDSESSC